MNKFFIIDGNLVNMDQVVVIRPVKKYEKEVTHIKFTSGYSIQVETKFEDILKLLISLNQNKPDKNAEVSDNG